MSSSTSLEDGTAKAALDSKDICATQVISRNDGALSIHDGETSDMIIDAAVERNIVRKLDTRLLPVLSFMYLSNAIDRSNLGNAKTDALLEDLNMTGAQYSVSGFRPQLRIMSANWCTIHAGPLLRHILWLRRASQYVSEKIHGEDHAFFDDVGLGLCDSSPVCCLQLGWAPRLPAFHGAIRGWVYGWYLGPLVTIVRDD